MTTLHRLAALLALAAGAAALAGAAGADGGPSPGVLFGGAGVSAPGGAVRYVALPSDRGTLVESIRTRDGKVLRWFPLRGPLLGIPVVAGDGTTDGLSHDRRTLVLVSSAPGAGAATATRLVLFDTQRFRVARALTLRGSFSFDALSPDGSTVYLIQYTSARDWSRYRVRAYDVRAGRLLPGAIVDKREPGETMAGAPVTRATSADGGWVYTLYGRQAQAPFVHALDTRRRSAVCIDLPWRAGQQGLWTVRMALGREGLVLSQRGRGRLAVVDLRTFTVRAISPLVGPGSSAG